MRLGGKVCFFECASFSCAEYSGKRRRMHHRMEPTVRCDDHVNWRTSFCEETAAPPHNATLTTCMRACARARVCLCAIVSLPLWNAFLRYHWVGQIKIVRNRLYVSDVRRKASRWKKFPAATAWIARMRAAVSYYLLWSFFFRFWNFAVFSYFVGAHLASSNKANTKTNTCRVIASEKVHTADTKIAKTHLKQMHRYVCWTLQWIDATRMPRTRIRGRSMPNR